MSIDALLSEIETAQSRGATVLVKWDGERKADRCTVLVDYPSADWFWRRDTDNPASALAEGLAAFKSVADTAS